MDTKFKNRHLLIKALDKCIECRYHLSTMTQIRNIIANYNTKFEQALCSYEYPRLQDWTYHTVSRIYHRLLTQHNDYIRKNKQED